MIAYQVVMLVAGALVVAYAAWVLGHMVADELRRTWRPDVTRQVWMKAEDPRRLVTVRTDRNGNPSIAVRADKTEGWDQ